MRCGRALGPRHHQDLLGEGLQGAEAGVILEEVAEVLAVRYGPHAFWADAHLAAVWSLLARPLQDGARQVLEEAREEHRRVRAQALGLAAFSQEAFHAAPGELQLGSRGTGHGLLRGPARGRASSFRRLYADCLWRRRPSWTVLLTGASPGRTSYSCPLYPWVTAPRCHGGSFVTPRAL